MIPINLSELPLHTEFTIPIKLSDDIIIDTLYKKIDREGKVQLLMYGVKVKGLTIENKNVSEPATFLTLRPKCTVYSV